MFNILRHKYVYFRSEFGGSSHFLVYNCFLENKFLATLPYYMAYSLWWVCSFASSDGVTFGLPTNRETKEISI